MYDIYSNKKKKVINIFNNESDFSVNAILISGQEAIGKSILSFNIAKNYLNEKDLISIFFNNNFLYLLKSSNLQEIGVILIFLKDYLKKFNSNEIRNEKDEKLLKVYVYKIIFNYLKILSQYFYNVSLFKKDLKGKELENLSKNFFKLKELYFNIFNQNIYIKKDDIEFIIDLENDILNLYDNLKIDYIYMQEILCVQKWIEEKPYKEKKIIIIENAHKMTVEVENAFLKTLEEPKEGTKFILTTSSKEKLLPTILSRCLKYNIEKLENSELKDIIAYEWGNEFLGYLNYCIYNFKRFFEILLNEERTKLLNKKAEEFTNNLILNELNIYSFYKIIKEKEISDNLEFFLDELIIILSNKFEEKNKNIDFDDKNLTLFNYKNLLNYLQKLKYISKELNFSIEDGLLYLVLNKDYIIDGAIDEIKHIL